MEKILISACLVGDKTRYDGKSLLTPLLDKLLEKFELVPFCPEVEGGLSIPRLRAEIKDDVVITEKGNNVTKAYELGAEKAWNICFYLGIRYAILVDNSPSCGSTKIYDGSFKGKLIKGEGVTTRQLRAKGIKIIPHTEIQEFLDHLDELEAK